jgi:hypothetical protein
MNAGGNVNMANNAPLPSWANPTINCNIVTGGLPSVALQPGQESTLTYQCNAHWTPTPAGVKFDVGVAATGMLVQLVSEATRPVDLSLILDLANLPNVMNNVVLGVNYQLMFMLNGYFQVFPVGVVLSQQKWTAFTWYLGAEVAEIPMDIILSAVEVIGGASCPLTAGAGCVVAFLVVLAVNVGLAEVPACYLRQINADP